MSDSTNVFIQKLRDHQDDDGSIKVSPWPSTGDHKIRVEVKDSDYDRRNSGMGHAVVKMTREEAMQLIMNIIKVMRSHDA